MTHRLVMMHHYTKFGCKRLKKNQEIWKKQLIFEDLTLHCDLALDDRDPTFLQDTLGHDDAPSCQVWMHTVQWFRQYLPDKGVSVTHGQMER